MKYNERTLYPLNPKTLTLKDTTFILNQYHNYILRCSPGIDDYIQVIEIARKNINVDNTFNVPVGETDTPTRNIRLPFIHVLKSGNVTKTATDFGNVATRRDNFYVSHKSLIEADYFPTRGDYILFQGMALMILQANLDGNAFIGQTQVWTGLIMECTLPAQGDGNLPPVITTPGKLPLLANTKVGSGWNIGSMIPPAPPPNP